MKIKDPKMIIEDPKMKVEDPKMKVEIPNMNIKNIFWWYNFNKSDVFIYYTQAIKIKKVKV